MSERSEIRRGCVEDRIYAVSHPGGRERNEDDFLVTSWDQGWILAVADGLGGHRAGEVASRCAIRSLAVSLPWDYSHPKEEMLRQVFAYAHEEIRSRGQGEWAGMGTTLVAACLTGRTAIVAHTGDSRAYVIRDKVIYRTRDHSVVQGLVDGGVLTEEEARQHPLKNMLTAALGIDFQVDVESVTLRGGDFVLLSSDGFHEFITKDRLVYVLRNQPFPESGEILLQEVLDKTTDNVTLVLYRVPEKI
ncbi:MAG: protein phosphatase 2C domain-containing protein [Methanomicrobiales archaeon]|nr:protein phosphatase 2C domain-containing protein [Methanomicrobiales archaeon]